MTRIGSTLSVLCVLVLAALPAQAEECVPGRSEAPSFEHDGKTYYAVIDPSLCPGCPTGVHVILYEESNDIDGLQRHDARRDDTCGLKVDPDRDVQPA